MRYLAVDFGSTYTKVTAIEVENARSARIVGTAQAFTTIATDVREGLDTALARLASHIGDFVWDRLLCCSSAAGGLAMVALGLVPELTAKAARMAAENAGAKVLRTFAFEISPTELAEIQALKPDIVLLCGGTDGGNKEVILHNARRLAELDTGFSLIVAGNKSAAAELDAILAASGKRYVITDNVMPTFGTLNIEPAQTRIREVFIERIIDAKGLSRIQEMTPYPIVPTPLAVLRGCELLSRGTKNTPGLGDLMAVDLGGATTDVYSMASGAPSLDNVLLKGLPEPAAKRTVEGDLGMRYSLPFLLEDAGVEKVAELAGVEPDDVRRWAERCLAEPETLAPHDGMEKRIDEALAQCAIARALTRHCGVLEKVFTPMGEFFTLTGKDLLHVPLLVGIGGALRHGTDPQNTLRGAVELAGKLAPQRMVPKTPEFAVDANYIISAMGLLSTVDPEAALAIMRQQLQPSGHAA